MFQQAIDWKFVLLLSSISWPGYEKSLTKRRPSGLEILAYIVLFCKRRDADPATWKVQKWLLVDLAKNLFSDKVQARTIPKDVVPKIWDRNASTNRALCNLIGFMVSILRGLFTNGKLYFAIEHSGAEEIPNHECLAIRWWPSTPICKCFCVCSLSSHYQCCMNTSRSRFLALWWWSNNARRIYRNELVSN